MRSKILISTGIVIIGLALGVFQKWLDTVAINELPGFMQTWDPVNYFGRLAIWILIATVISVFSKTPFRAAVNTFLFFISMVAGYYIYCQTVLGFLPVSYMMIWVVISFISFFLAFVCWYAKGKGIIPIIISGVILGTLLAQAFILTQGIYVTHWPEVITWVIGMTVLLRKPKEFAIEFVISIVAAVLYQLVIPYYG